MKPSYDGPPRPQKAPGALTYTLEKWIIKRREGEATVHLHGENRGKKHIEIMTLKLLAGETDAELVSCAAWVSTSRWFLDHRANVTHFRGKFDPRPNDRFLETLPDQASISSSTDA